MTFDRDLFVEYKRIMDNTMIRRLLTKGSTVYF